MQKNPESRLDRSVFDEEGIMRRVLGIMFAPLALIEGSLRLPELPGRNRVVYHNVHLPSFPCSEISSNRAPIAFSPRKIVYHLR
jgi:hypothetical protein